MNMPIGLYGAQGRFSKSLPYGQHYYKRATIKASASDEAFGFNPIITDVAHFGSTCYKFVRPYAMKQAVISTLCLFARVLVENPQLFKWSVLFKAFPGVLAIIVAHAYFNGINQIYDVDIDRMNKPYLPIPAGELSLKQAWILVIFDLVAGLSILRLMNADIITTSLYSLGLLIAHYYSAPPIRFKRFSLATSILLPLTSGGLHNVGVLYSTIASLGLQFSWSPPITFIVAFAILFFVVISISKDLTDVEGDLKNNIRTFTAIFGPRNITLFCTGMLLLNYIGGILAAICMPQAFKSYLMVPAHAIFSLWLLFQAKKLDKANYTQESSAKFYNFLWNLLNLEFLLFPFI